MKSISIKPFILFLSISLSFFSCSDDGNPDPSCTVGSSCDDSDPLTSNDVYDNNCDCSGTAICTVGASCNDNNALTENDVYDNNCSCSGTPVCTVGDFCDDGNANTYNETYNEACECGGGSMFESFTDTRDGQTYKTIKIGTQTWLAENLNYDVGNSSCYDNSASNCTAYGRLYDWETATSVCPTGWHLPSDDEWTELINYLGGEALAGGRMKETGTSYWNSPNSDASNSSGFSARPGGRQLTNGYANINQAGYWWSSTESSSTSAYNRYLIYNGGSVTKTGPDKGTGQSVCCVKD